MAENRLNQAEDLVQLPENESQSEDDIDKLVTEELNRQKLQQLVAIHTPGTTDPLDPGNGDPFNDEKISDDGTRDDQVAGHLVNFNGDSRGNLIFSDGASRSSSVLGSFWNWSTNTYRWTRQLFVEGLGYGSKTIDTQLHAEVVALYQTRRAYKNICNIVSWLISNFEQFLAAEQELGNAFQLMSIQEESLTNSYQHNTELLAMLHKNGPILLAAMRSFISGIQTLCNQTMVDTLWTSKQLNHARIQYDALKSELDALRAKNSDGQKLRDLERSFEEQKSKYESIKENLQVKLKFLHDHRVSVMHNQLESFQKAIKDYFTGSNVPELDGILHSVTLQHCPSSPSDLES